MPGIGEAAAIVGLIAPAAQLSNAIIGIVGRYRGIQVEIESFGCEVGSLGKVLDRPSRLLVKDDDPTDIDVRVLICEMVNECNDVTSRLSAFNDKLCKVTITQRIL